MKLLATTKAWKAYHHPNTPHSIHFYRDGHLHSLALWLNGHWDPRRPIPQSPPIPATLLRSTETRLRLNQQQPPGDA